MRPTRIAILAALALVACRAEVHLESPDERMAARADTAGAAPVAVDTIYRPMPIDSVGASFAWLVDRPAPLVPANRTYPDGPEEAARQFVRALAQTGSSTKGTIGTGDVGYQRAFTYVHPGVRGRRSAERWARALAGIVRPAVVQMLPVPEDTTRVFAELLVLREIDGQSILGLYYGHFSAAPGDNGWQLTGGRFQSEDWESPLADHQPWRYDRAGAAREYAGEDPDYALNLVRLQSGEWVPLARPTPRVDLRFGLPEPR